MRAAGEFIAAVAICIALACIAVWIAEKVPHSHDLGKILAGVK